MRRNKALLNFWPAIADFMLALFMVALATGILGSLLAVLQSVGGLGRGTSIPIEDYEKLKRERDEFADALGRLHGKVILSWEEHQRLVESPPVVVIKENQEMRFDTGSAKLSEEFSASLERDVFPELTKTLTKFDRRIDTLVIVGHTDAQPIRGTRPGLDDLLLPVLHGKATPASLTAGSNADLGLMRAIAVREVLQPWLMTQGFRHIGIRCLSAAHGIAVDGGIPPLPEHLMLDSRQLADKDRRRIEIMFFGLDPRN